MACYASSSIAVVDVSNPASPAVKQYISLPGSSYPLFLEAKGNYIFSISNAIGGMISAIDPGSA